MILPDVNLLLYAVITGFSHHTRARAWWEGLLNSWTQVGLTAPAVFGFVRLSTNARVLESPLAVPDAADHVRTWLARPNVRFLPSSAEQVETALGMVIEVGTAGNLTTDAQLAAAAIDQQAEVASNDTDFARFTGLNWSNPLR